MKQISLVADYCMRCNNLRISCDGMEKYFTGCTRFEPIVFIHIDWAAVSESESVKQAIIGELKRRDISEWEYDRFGRLRAFIDRRWMRFHYINTAVKNGYIVLIPG